MMMTVGVHLATVCFGEFRAEVLRDALEELDGYRSLWKDDFPGSWEGVPESFKKPLAKSVGLKTSHFEMVSDGARFEAEWDDVTSNVFREEELWIGTTYRAGVRIRNVHGTWLLITIGSFDGFRVASRVSRALFGVHGKISSITIPPSVLKTVLQADSRSEKFMWWEGIETGVDGALKGALPRSGGTRERFDRSGLPYFARFESTSLNKQLSISCKRGSVGGPDIRESEATRYFLERIFPHLPRRG